MKFEQSYRYASVNGIDSLPEIHVAEVEDPPDSLSERDLRAWRDSVDEVRRERRRAQRDSIRKGLKEAPARCDSTGVHFVTSRRREPDIAIARSVPCDRQVLWNSPDLPVSIYDEGEEIFGSSERDALIKEALALGAQPPFAIGRIPPTVKWGLEFTRFNRVEGFSSGLLVEQPLGAGYTASVFGRIGHADLEPNFELGLARSNLATTVRVRGYNRLVAANDWGNPLSFGSSLSALLFGRDEGYYYRASGAELEWLREDGSRSWRLFAERQRSAAIEHTWSLGPPFIPNLSARTAQYAGAAARLVDGVGLDVNGFRAFSDLRLEGAVSDSAGAAYGRAALDISASQGLGPAAVALTLSAGASAGTLPPQRRWYLGGPHTVRGQWPDTSRSGDAYWLGRLELGRSMRALRPVVFGDIGWVGKRASWREIGKPMSGAGVGLSIMDGLIRFDASRGFNPGRRVRFDTYIEARF
jgi:hypothetical protein